ncbi:hypothetical protein NQZ68_017891 [Dissostichus eleginoides]|nr:hypothetical protein NQZ68_017891 [Dissostichus eleginoides]
MDSSDEEEYYDVSDSLPDPCCEEGKNTPAAPESEHVPPPGEVIVLDSDQETVSLGFPPTENSAGFRLQLDYSCETHSGSLTVDDSSPVKVDGLIPGTEYTFSITRIADNGNQSKATSLSVFTEPSPPVQITVDQVSSESLSLHWDPPAGEVESYIVTCCSEGDIMKETTDRNKMTFNNLKPGECYFLEVSTKLRNGRISRPTVTSANTNVPPPGEVTVLDSDQETVSLGFPPTENSAGFRLQLDYSCETHSGSLTVDDSSPVKVDGLIPGTEYTFSITRIADNGNQSKATSLSVFTEPSPPVQITVDQVSSESLSLHWDPPAGEVESYIVTCCSEGDIMKETTDTNKMTFSNLKPGECYFLEVFTKLQNGRISRPTVTSANTKTHLESLLEDLGLDQHYREKLSLSTVLSIDEKTITDEPAKCNSDLPWYFLKKLMMVNTSAAVFVFFDALNSECELLTNQHHKAQVFLVGNLPSKLFSLDAVKKVATKLDLTNSNILLKTKSMNDADFVKDLQEKVRNAFETSKVKMGIEQMSAIAHELGICVDEESPECQDAKKNADSITAEIQDILKYKEAQLPLQGQIWKDLTCLEKEEFRLRKVGSEKIEEYKSDLQVQKTKLREKQNSHDMSNAITCFINAISSPGIERFYFLKWMRMNLDNVSREKLCDLREQYKEKCKNSENKEEIKDIDKQLANSSLGTEHFFREMGQIYEASLSLPETDLARQQLQHLPKLCAELMLDGFPLELVDGEASNIPIRWVTDVLSQLNALVSPKNKILVVTVLGVQSTGKSTLLNTMFGVQFAVSSGRCTRGAFMLLIKINEDVRKDFNCDFMVIIDTEGLKSPELAQLDNSHEHDNELATLVVGLSDITIINIAMENSTEMKDILQIVVHAFLRMKEVGKKPKCQFVHQNVSDVSAHDKNLRDRKLLLQQLNEMTQAAAKMEKKKENMSFTDVMEYRPDTGNWYIPGLWNGNPPMAAVNAGYSEAVYELKKNIIHILESCGSAANNILEFTEWMKSLWTAVKHENFIFSFRNSLVADAYMRLCKEFNKWEWDFKKEMYTWVTHAETRLSNFGTPADKSNKSDMRELLMLLKNKALTELSKWETKLLGNLEQYFKQTEGHVYLVEGYKQEFKNSAMSLRREMERSVFNQLTAASDIRQGMTKLHRIRENHTKELENRVCALIEECWEKKVQMTEKELDEEFDKMWTKTFVTDTMQRKSNYHDTYIEEILNMIDERMQDNHDVETDITFELSLKQHICADAARRFQKMHQDFLHENDPYICLNKNKEKFLADFKDVFRNVDQCQKKAEEFTDRCLKPAVEDFVNRSLGPDIIGEMLTSEQFSTRMSFQYSVLLDLTSKDDFEKYQSFICSYEKYVKKWILNKILERFSDGSTMFEDQHLQSCVNSINNAIQKAKTEKSGNLKSFVEDVCQELGDKLVISQDALGAFMILNKADQEQFAHWLTECVKEMAQNLREKFKKTNIQTKLQSLHVNPQNELFNKLIGCGKQCPFCASPCEAGGTGQHEHFTSLHRPQALGQYRFFSSGKLVTDICSSSVITEGRFRCKATNWEWHPFKRYKEIFPDWKIPPDASLQASNYWKYVLVKYNKQLAEAFNAKPADIPATWREITPEQAEASLKEAFHIN